MDSLHTYSSELINKYKLQHIPIIENMWGHRFRTDQTPAIIFFELLCVIENQLQAKRKGLIDSIFSPKNETLYLKHRQYFKLRILIYQNEILETLIKSTLSDQDKWERQFEYLRNFNDDLFQFKDVDIAHLKSSFTSFESFYNAIKILSSLTFDPLSKKRWSSKFIYPISSEYIWCDFDNKGFTEDRRFFCRGGELTYLMLCRAGNDACAALEDAFETWLDDDDNSFSKIAKLLVREEERIPLAESNRKKLGYLPYEKLPIFTDLANNLLQVLSLELEKLDKIKVIIDLIGYHIGDYILAIGETYHNSSNPTALKKAHYLVEVLSKTTNSIRKSSIQSISAQRNKLKRSLYTQAPQIIGLYDDVIDSEEQNIKQENYKNELTDSVSYLSSHISNYPNVCFKSIGLLSKKNTRSYRYVLSEDFLHSLVIIILGNDKRLEFNSFINKLKTQFSIYVDVSPDNENEIIQRDLNRNSKNLASLLYQMGMLRHLSDACSYVINPYREDSV
ncbi:MAG: hypothetical protein ACJAXJ_001824 [Colwellia sp.]|jgi:hypothetical protein